MGEVELKTGIEIPIPDKDRVFPKEAKKRLAEVFKKNFPQIFIDKKSLTDAQLKNIACSLGIRNNELKGNHDTKYCCYDNKVKRFYYRESFISLIKGKLEEDKFKIEKFLQ